MDDTRKDALCHDGEARPAERIKLCQPVVVEGRYDQSKLASFLDAEILRTDGFQLFSNAPLCRMLKEAAETVGLIVLTDSDRAGFLIRNRIRQAVGEKGTVYHAYIPAIKGKEKRKDHPSKEGTIGVEGMSREVLLKALADAGVPLGGEMPPQPLSLTAADLFDLGLSGTPGAAEKRAGLLEHLGLPPRLSNKELLRFLNRTQTEASLRVLLAELE